jgi:hypothetical protein
MRSLALVLILAAAGLGCAGPVPGTPQSDDQAVSGVVITDDAIHSDGLPTCEDVLSDLDTDAEVVVSLADRGDVGVVFEGERAVCSDQLGTLLELGLVTIADLRAVAAALGVDDTSPYASGTPIPAKPDSMSSGTPIPAHGGMNGLTTASTPSGRSGR